MPNTKSGFLPKINLSSAIQKSHEKIQRQPVGKFCRPNNQSMINLHPGREFEIAEDWRLTGRQDSNSRAVDPRKISELRRNGTETSIHFGQMLQGDAFQEIQEDGWGADAVDTPRYQSRGEEAVDFN